MTSQRDSQISALLLAATPAPDSSPYEDWNAVLERAKAAAAARRTPRSRVILFARAGVGMAAVAALVFAAILFWPSADQPRVLDRALAAIGSGPIIHVTYRFKKDYAYVDLKTGRKTQPYQVYEEWLAPTGAVRRTYHANGRLEVNVTAPGKNALSSHEKQTFSGILNGYRKALENGTATLSAKVRFHGRDIYWVRFKGQKMLNVSNHKRRYQDWALEVAIDAATYKPVYLYETINGRAQQITGQEIVSVETLPSGSVDFTPTAQNHTGGSIAGGDSLDNPVDLTAELDTDAPTKALGAAPIWLGRNYRKQKLAYFRAGMITWGFAPPSVRPRDMKLHHTPALELCYGSTAVATISRNHHSVYCDYRGPHVRLQEALEPVLSFGWAVGPNSGINKIPEGLLRVFPGGGSGQMIENGVYISIDAKTEAAVIAAARALRPLRGGE
jgi:hypothetical protein